MPRCRGLKCWCRHFPIQSFERWLGRNTSGQCDLHRLLGHLLLPKMYATADQYGVTPRLSITASGVHESAKLTKDMVAHGKLIAWLNNEENAKGKGSYYEVSKLLEVLFVQELANHLKKREEGRTKVIVNVIDPGRGTLSFQPHTTYGPTWRKVFMTVLKAVFARSAEVGSRTIVNGGENDNFQTHGKYLSICQVFP